MAADKMFMMTKEKSTVFLCSTIGWSVTLVGNMYEHEHVVNLIARLNIPIKTLTSKSLAALYVQKERYGMYYQVCPNNPGPKTINWEYS